MHPRDPYRATTNCVLLCVLICTLILCSFFVAPQIARAQTLPDHPAAPTETIFVNSGQSLGGETGNGVALGDLDGDGDVDAFVANDFREPDEANHVWCNQGNGTFSSGPIFGATDGYAIALGDLDGDGDLDAVIAGDTANQVWLNDDATQGCEAISFVAGQSLGTFTAYGVALGDVDNDDDLDVLIVGNQNEIWLNNGDATFDIGPTFPFQFSNAAALIDLDSDGFLDAFIADSANGDNNQLWWNDGNWNPGPGTFSAGDILPTENLISDVGAGNLDGDNRPDLFLAASGPNQIFWNEGSRVFTTTGTLPANDNSFAIVLSDVDSDGDLDSVVGNITAAPNRVWRNEGSRVFTVTQEFGDEIGLYWSRALGVADLNGDLSPDLFDVTTAEDRVWFNQSTPPLIPNEEDWQIQLLDTRGDAGYSPSLALDANGYPHISYGRLYQGPDDTVSYLLYTRWDGVRWHNEFVDTSVSETSIAVDAGGTPHIAYTTGRGNILKLASWDGAEWQIQDVDQVDFPHTMALGSFVLDANDLPYLIYNTFSNTSGEPELLKYAHWDGAAWQIQTIDNGLTYDSALAIDADGTPHATYAFREEFDTYVLKYAFWDGTTWQSEIVDGEVEDAGVFLTSLALDDSGNPHIGYVLDAFNGSDLLKYAYWDGASWHSQSLTTLDPDREITDISVDLDSQGRPHLFYYLSNPSAPSNGEHWLQYWFWDGVSWQESTLDSGEETTIFRDDLVAMALDAADRLHAAYYEPHYEDLRYITWAPNWQVRTIPETGTVEIPSIAVANAIPHIGYYSQTGGQVKLAGWDDAWTLNPLDFVNEPVPDLAVAAGPQYEHISYYDADNGRLMYSYWNGAAWIMEVVDETGNAGRYNDLVLAGHADGSPRIAYWDDTTLRVKLALPVINSPLWNLYPNNAGPPLDSSSGPLSAALLPGGMGVSYYDGVSGDLRLAVWSAATATWTDEQVDGVSSDAGRLSSLQSDWVEGVPVIAYYDETNDVINIAYKESSGWQIQPAVSEAGGVSSLSLELGLNSRRRAQIAYTTGGGELNVAVLSNGIWHIEVIESGTAALRDVSLARDAPLHLTYVHAANGLQYAFRTATLDVDNANPAAPPSPTTGDYNPLDPCPEDPSPTHALESSRATHPTFPSTLPGQNEQLNDQSVFDGMLTLFKGSQKGQEYTDLYHELGAEMGQLGLDDPTLLWDAYGTLQNFLPGLEALITGRGDEVVVTEEMVEDALDIWQRLAAAGTPALANAINAELAKYNNLQDFVGMSFDEWAETIGVPPHPTRCTYPHFTNEKAESHAEAQRREMPTA